jgi:serine phosphatase RsbU (regulator of sigma subunit)
MHRQLDATLAERFHGASFVTGQLATLDLRQGTLRWVNAGHPNPLLLRNGRVVGPLVCRPSMPWGLGGALVEQAEEQLEPGDVVVFYSDGVVEGRSSDGASFGIERFVSAIEEAVASDWAPELTLRRAIADIAAFQQHRLRDDATILWLSWRPDGDPVAQV